MGDSPEKLLAFQRSDECFTVPYADIRDLQIAAMNERLQERMATIPLVGMRAREAGISEIRRAADIVPLLLPHTAYKSYPERFLVEGRWDKLTRWLGTVSSRPLDNVYLDGVTDIDGWLERLERAGHYVSCSSGTTGKSAMLLATRWDLEWAGRSSAAACAWASGIQPIQDRYVFSLAPVADVPRNRAVLAGQREAFGWPDVDLFRYPVPPITVGSITRMIALRKAIADGSAKPADVEEYERTADQRERSLADAIAIAVDALSERRGEKLFLTGMWANLYKIAIALRERGFRREDFHPENILFVGGGLKREQLPPNYREITRDAFNVAPAANVQIYGMQELGSNMPRCSRGRYHLPPTLVCLPLDEEGERLLDPGTDEIQCRAAFFDVALEGRWGGLISGDHMAISFHPCECGAASPSIRDNVVRYADIKGDDKLNCSGTIDAYVRGTL